MGPRTFTTVWELLWYNCSPDCGSSARWLNGANGNLFQQDLCQTRFQQYVNWELPEVQAGLRKGRGTRGQMANICWTTGKARNFRKTSTSTSLTTLKPLWVTINRGKFLKEMGTPDHLICLLRNLYAGQEATARTGHGKTDWFQIEKAVHQGCTLSSCLFNLYSSTSCEMPGWMKHKLESRLPGEISITSDMQTTLRQKVKN